MSKNITYNFSDISEIIIYCRVSTKKQSDDDNTGLKSQYKSCLDYIRGDMRYNNIKISYIEEIGSTYNNQDALPKLKKIIEIMGKKVLFIVSEVSRFGRNLYQATKYCEEIELKESYIYSVTEQICFGLDRILDQAFFQKIIEAEAFSNNLSVKAKNRIRIARENGEYVGGRIPFGKMIIKNNEDRKILVDNPVEQEFILTIKHSLINNGESFYKVHRELIEGNMLNQQWPISKLKTIVKNNFTSDERNRINYKFPITYNNNINKKNKNEAYYEDDVEQIEFKMRKKMLIK
jgi:DNA invertase Pin-like site-specific DNA recombinase